jgi:hypothetical protein
MVRLAVVGTEARRFDLLQAFHRLADCSLQVVDRDEQASSQVTRNFTVRTGRDVPELQMLENQDW